MSKFSFKILKEDKKSKARVGEIITPHGKIKTPAFMPVGTLGTVKTLSPDELEKLNAQIILGNTYHLYLRPGLDVIKKFSGLHNFMNWKGPILTDSGGYQVFSLNHLRKFKKDGVEFKSHLNGDKHFFTPEKVIDIQQILGSDIMMVLDDCAPSDSNHSQAKEAMERTHKWAKRSIKYWQKKSKVVEGSQSLFGIVQGVVYNDLREESAKFISSLPFDGIAIGGLAIGEERKVRFSILELVEPYLPKEKPRYPMGFGEPIDLLESVERGMDMFDCVMPTRIARNGAVWTKRGRINLRNAKFAVDKNPIEKDCQCFACKNFSKAYISHLIKEKEVLGIRLTTIHNLYFILNLMKNIQESIRKNRFLEFKKKFIKEFNS